MSEDEAIAEPPQSLKTKGGVLFILLSLLGCIFFACFHKQVFPCASIDMRLSAAQARDKSRELAQSLGFDLKGQLQPTIFADDNHALTVLEFNLGVDRANQLMRHEVPVWLWQTRFCKYHSDEQLYVSWTADGQLVLVNRNMFDEIALPTISREQARRIAVNFVQNQAGLSLQDYALFDQGSFTRANRTDHHFVWRKLGYPKSQMQIRVDIAGNLIRYFRYHLEPSDAWSREYKAIRQANQLLGSLAMSGVYMLVIATVAFFLKALVSNDLRWKPVLFGSLVMAVLTFLSASNAISAKIYQSYSAHTDFAGFLMQTLLANFNSALTVFMIAILIVGGAEYAYRRNWPDEIAAQNLFDWPGLGQRDTRNKIAAGYILAGLMMFWLISYYQVGKYFGYFCPLSIDDYRSIGTFCPAVDGAELGLRAAGLEELTCRVVGLVLFQKLTGRFWLANFLQAAIWGFAHSSYPQQPCYARGIELTVVGLFFGWFIRRYGFIPGFVAHYVYDAFLTVQPLFASQHWSLILPAILVLLPFAMATAFSALIGRVKKYNSADPSLLNKAQLQPHNQQEADDAGAEKTFAYQPLGPRKRLVLFILLPFAVLVGFSCSGLVLPPHLQNNRYGLIGGDNKITVNAAQAQVLARDYLLGEGKFLEGYQSVCTLLSEPSRKDSIDTWQYIYEHKGLAETKDLYRDLKKGFQYRVYFFKPGDPQVFDVYMTGRGEKLFCTSHGIDETPGARLSREGALANVNQYLQKNRPELSPLVLDSETAMSRLNRMDYKFTFNLPFYSVDRAPAKLFVELDGDAIARINNYFEVPDRSWKAPHNREKWYQQIISCLHTCGWILLVVTAVTWALKVMRNATVPWKPALVFCAVIALSLLVWYADRFNQVLIHYDTSQDLPSYLASAAASQLGSAVLWILAFFILSLTALICLRQYFPQSIVTLSQRFLFNPKNAQDKKTNKAIWLDACLGSYALVATVWAIFCLEKLVLILSSPALPIDTAREVVETFICSIPFLNLITEGFDKILVGLGSVVVLAGIIFKYILPLKKRSFILLLIVLWAALATATNSWYWQTTLISWAFHIVLYLTIIFFVWKFFRFNLLAYLLAGIEFFCLHFCLSLVQHTQGVANGEIGMLIVFASLPLVLLCLFSFLHREDIR